VERKWSRWSASPACPQRRARAASSGCRAAIRWTPRIRRTGVWKAARAAQSPRDDVRAPGSTEAGEICSKIAHPRKQVNTVWMGDALRGAEALRERYGVKPSGGWLGRAQVCSEYKRPTGMARAVYEKSLAVVSACRAGIETLLLCCRAHPARATSLRRSVSR
jgi:hypothetical protein